MQFEATCKVYKEWYVNKSIKENLIDFIEDFQTKSFPIKLLGVVLLLVAFGLVLDNPKIAIAISLVIFAQLCFKSNEK